MTGDNGNEKVRIKAEMNMQDMFLALCEGNPGALRVCMELFKGAEQIDPGSFHAGFASLLMLDTLKIYGPRIWMLYKDVCGENLVKMVALLRAYQLGQLAGVTENALNHAIDNRGAGLNIDLALKAVKEKMPNFNNPKAK